MLRTCRLLITTKDYEDWKAITINSPRRDPFGGVHQANGFEPRGRVTRHLNSRLPTH